MNLFSVYSVSTNAQKCCCRAYSGRTPVEEYALETRSAYARLLTDFRREALAALFWGSTAPPDVFGS